VFGHSAITPCLGGGVRVPELHISDCARGCNHRDQSWPMLHAIDVTANTFFERLYLVPGLREIALWVNCLFACTIPTVQPTTIARFLCNFFLRMAPHFFGNDDSQSNLAKSRYPPWGDIFECCFKAQSSKLESLFSLKKWKRDLRALSFKLSKMSPQMWDWLYQVLVCDHPLLSSPVSTTLENLLRILGAELWRYLRF